MPAYEYICDKCHESFSLRIPYALYGEQAVVCPHCGSREVTRNIGKVRIARSAEQRTQRVRDLAETGALEAVDEDPVQAGRTLRDLGRESGAEMGEKFDEVVERLEHGQTSRDLEQGLPDSE
ncbi:MAG: hypothetical protein PWQ55_199 [Chloroflexota bacterium]|nr:hypothetical protein [Chloroflexota bacterium]